MNERNDIASTSVPQWKLTARFTSLILLVAAVVTAIGGYVFQHTTSILADSIMTSNMKMFVALSVLVLAIIIFAFRSGGLGMWIRRILWVVLTIIILMGIVHRDKILNKLPAGWFGSGLSGDEEIVQQLSGVAENWRFCFREKDETKWECSHDNGSKYMATMKEHIADKVLKFDVCWNAGCSIYRSDLNSSTKGKYKNSVTGSTGRWELSSPEGGGFVGTAIGTEGRGIGVEYDIRLQPLSL